MRVAVTYTRRVWRSGLLAAAFVTLTGCQTVHEVVVDAISNQEKPMGASYRLEVHDPSGGVDPALGAQAISDVKDALAARGLYEAPASARPDMVIDLEYGVGPGQIKIVHRSRPIVLGGGLMPPEDYGDKPIMVFEKYITLSAREPVPAETTSTPARGRNSKRGEELWNVHVSVEDQKKELAPYLPVLASVSIDYMGENSGKETRIPVKAEDAAAALHRQEARSAPTH
jgi:hypothetical protein